MYVSFTHKNNKFIGISEGGIRTSIICPNMNLMFDVGALPVDFAHIENLFLTHAHLDHSAGIPYYVSQRSLRSLKPPNIYVPEENYENFLQILSIYQKMEGFDYKYNLIPAKRGVTYSISNSISMMPLETFHRVPSQGYTIYEKSMKLKDEYRSLVGTKLADMKKEGVILTEEKLAPLVSFSGDTKIEYVLSHPDVANSKILFLESTYLCEERDVSRAREWGHLHLDEIAANAHEFKNEKLVLIHFSKRYSLKRILELVKKKLPSDLFERTICFIKGAPKIE
ncbi:MAG: MBL fold metallo-hydrolase [Leptospiraceae bacterium]|nr:MBL fold metallo-hydrolase [Leptospiraceae bacterium]